MDEMKALKIPITVYCHNALLEAFATKLQYDDVEKQLEFMKRGEFPPNEETYGTLIAVFAGKLKLDWALKYFLEMKEHFLPREQVFTSLIAGFGELKDVETQQHYYRMLKKLQLPLSSRTMGLMVKATEDPKNIKLYIEDMVSLGVKPDAVLCRMMFRKLAVAGDFKTIDFLFQCLDRFGLQPSQSDFLLIVDVLSRKSPPNLPQIQLFLQQMKKLGLEPTLEMYESLLWAHAQTGNLPNFQRTFKEMVQRFAPPPSILPIMLHLINRLGDVELQEKLFEDMKSTNFVLDANAYGSLITSFSKNGQLEKAGRYLEEMRDLGLKPSAATYVELIKSYGTAGRTSAMMALFWDLAKQHSEVPVPVYLSMLDAFRSQDDKGEWSNFLETFQTEHKSLFHNIPSDIRARLLKFD
jgi:pentatricopeptide repeat protein